jgi:hypothetical protein
MSVLQQHSLRSVRAYIKPSKLFPLFIRPITQPGFRSGFAPGMVRSLDPGFLALLAPLCSPRFPIGPRTVNDASR